MERCKRAEPAALLRVHYRLLRYLLFLSLTVSDDLLVRCADRRRASAHAALPCRVGGARYELSVLRWWRGGHPRPPVGWCSAARGPTADFVCDLCAVACAVTL